MAGRLGAPMGDGSLCPKRLAGLNSNLQEHRGLDWRGVGIGI